MAKKRILLTNDDGYGAAGLEALARVLEVLGDITIVAPAAEQSAKSHAITLGHPLRLRQMRPDGARFSLDGTPSDCVYMGVNKVLKDSPPDLICSGINHGPNVGSDVIYSGTVAAAVEGALLGIPSIAFSLARGSDFDGAARLAARLAKAALNSPLIPPGIALNVNFPEHLPLSDDGNTAIAVARLGTRTYGGEVIERVDPRGKPYLWVGGSEAHYDLSLGTDCEAVYGRGIPSVTPIAADITSLQDIPRLSAAFSESGLKDRNSGELKSESDADGADSSGNRENGGRPPVLRGRF